MRNSVTRRTALVATALCAAATTALRAQTPIIIKFSHVVARDTPKGRGADYFARRAAELTRGRVLVEVYPNSQLYKDKEEMEALQLGAVQMLAPSLSKFAPLGVRELEVFDLPYLFDGYEQLHKVTQGPVGKNLFERLQSKGIVGLAYWDNGFKSVSANRPLHGPEAFSNLKMRIQSSRVLYAQMHALGAIPKVLAFSEVYQALKSREVDGTENPHSNLYTQRMYEVQKDMTLTNHGYLGYAVVVNRKFWEGLPTDIRDGLTQAMKEATEVANDDAKQDNETALEKIRATGRMTIHLPTEDERAALKSALIPVHREMSARIGEETIQAIYKVTGFDPNKLRAAAG